MEHLFLPVFMLNWLLILVDASIGYRLAPFLAGNVEEAVTVKVRLRRLLATVVALAMFVNCLAYFRGHERLLLVVTGLLIVDIVGQGVVRWRLRRGRKG